MLPLFLFFAATAVAAEGPTVSEVCPAFTFDHDWSTAGGPVDIKFLPHQNGLFEKIDWVDVHVGLFDKLTGRQLPGTQKNVRMDKAYTSGFVASIDSPQLMAESVPDNAAVKYSFTYCVEVDGSPVDCDTKAFDVITVKYFWEPLPVTCATECGFAGTMVLPEVMCLGTDGNTYEDVKCSNLPRPAAVLCPGTEPCVTFARRQTLVECPMQCGLKASVLLIPTECIGSDGNTYPDTECTEAKPDPILCPATPSCVEHFWEPLPVSCATECGFAGAMVLPEAVCMGTDGNTYKNVNCENEPRPAAIDCPATPACVEYFWEPLPVTCPTECGFPDTMVLPEVVCMGTDGEYEGDDKCANERRPEAIQCPATEPCVTFSWSSRAGIVECPSECGLEASIVHTPSACFGSDGQKHSDDRCVLGEKPGFVECPATEECRLTPLGKVCPMIPFDHNVQSIDMENAPPVIINFKPLGKGIERRRFDWVDVHVSMVDGAGNMVPGSVLVNHRMKEPTSKDNFVWTRKVNMATPPGYRMAYSFTYCIEMVDCDTQQFFFNA